MGSEMCIRDRLERAFSVLKQMQEEGVKPNTATYTCLVDACGKAQQLERAFEVLGMMTEVHVQPNTHTYNALIDACAKGSEVDRAFDVLRQMESDYVQPNTTTYTALIDACGKTQQLERALPHASMTELNETIDGLAPAARISPSSASASFQCFDFLYHRMSAL